MLGRLVLAELTKWSLENADVRDRIYRHRVSQRAQRRRRALSIAGLALGLVVAGVVAKRLGGSHARPPDVAAPVSDG